MIGFFGQKSEVEKLQSKYRKLMSDAHILSSSNRKLSDQKAYEAEMILRQLEKSYKN